MIWPEYFDAELHRSEGRRVPLSLAVKKPTVDDVARALKSLGIGFTVERDKCYPRFWWKRSGRVVASTDISKEELLKIIAEKIKEMRRNQHS